MTHILREYHKGFQPQARYAHSTIVIGSRLYLWGGFQCELPTVHDSPEKVRLTSWVNVLHLDTGKWEHKATRGLPHPGVYGYACVRGNGNSIVFFGGCCGHDLCFHNSLTELSTDTYTWRTIAQPMERYHGPMRKSYCGMIPLLSSEGFFVVGGNGVKPMSPVYGTQYPTMSEGRVVTDEQHLYFSNHWISPSVIGERPPPCAAFSFSPLSDNSGVMFGGLIPGPDRPNNDVFVAELMSGNVIQWKKIPMYQLEYDLPKARRAHAGVLINQQVLLVVGGRDRNNETISDCWILELMPTGGIWRKLLMPDVVTNRCYCSVSTFVKSPTCVWLVLFGGTRGKTGASQHLRDLQIVELLLSDGQWSVGKFPNIGDFSASPKISPRISVDNDPRKFHHQFQHQLSLMPVVPTVSDGKDQQIARLKVELDDSRVTVSQLQQEVEQLRKERDNLQKERAQLEFEKYKTAQFERNEKCEQDPPHWVVSPEEIKLTDEKLGDGSYGTVRVAEFRGLRVAVKLLHKLILSPYNQKMFSREMDIASKLRHPNLLQFIGATMEDTPIIITELMPTSLYQVIFNHRLQRSEVLSIGLDVARAMNYLHLWKPEPMLHRDISSPNVLLDHATPSGWKGKLGDFGSANLQSHTQTDMPGNVYYAAPEARYPEDHSPAMDVYSFGVLLIEMTLCQKPGFTISNREEQLQTIGWMSMKSLISRCIAREHRERLHISQALKLLLAMDS